MYDMWEMSGDDYVSGVFEMGKKFFEFVFVL